MLDIVGNVLAPHYCCSCGEIGTVFCDYCKYDIICDPFERCIMCLGPVEDRGAHCSRCAAPYVRAWCVAERAGAVKILIDAFKFDGLRGAAKPLGEFISSALPDLPDNLVIASVPTVSTHIRQRGYDHAALIAREVARQRGVKYQALLKRRTTTVQQGARRKERLKQAEGAFEAARHIDGSTVLIIDDIFTTGATLHYAAITLLAAGAREVWVAVVARQPLDDPVSL